MTDARMAMIMRWTTEASTSALRELVSRIHVRLCDTEHWYRGPAGVQDAANDRLRLAWANAELVRRLWARMWAAHWSNAGCEL